MKKFIDLPLRFAFLIFLSVSLMSSTLNLKENTTKNGFVSIEKLVKTRKLIAKATGLGGHRENCIELDLQNPTNETLKVLIEPGRRLIAKDSSFQDILLVKKNEIILKPHEKLKVLAYGFCCQSRDSSPKKGAKFSLGKMAPQPWVKLANVISENSFPASSVQSAVWVLSDNHPFSSIHATDLRQIDLLRRTVAKIKGVELTWYTVTYVEDGTSVFSGKHNKVAGSLEYFLKDNAKVTILVNDKSGKPVTILTKDVLRGKGSYTFYMDLSVEDWPRGEYDVMVYENGTNVNIKKTFSL